MNPITLISTLLLIATLQSTLGQQPRHVTLHLREVEVSEESEESSNKKIHRILEVDAVGGESFYAKAIHGDSELLFRGKVTELPDRLLKIEYRLDQSYLDNDSQQPPRIEGTVETRGAFQDGLIVLENSDSRSPPNGNSTHWELMACNFHIGLGYMTWAPSRLNIRLVDEDGNPVKGALVNLIGFAEWKNNGSMEQSNNEALTGSSDPTGEDGIFVWDEAYFPFTTLIAEHDERNLIAIVNLERFQEAPKEEPYILKMRERVPEDEDAWHFNEYR